MFPSEIVLAQVRLGEKEEFDIYQHEESEPVSQSLFEGNGAQNFLIKIMSGTIKDLSFRDWIIPMKGLMPH